MDISGIIFTFLYTVVFKIISFSTSFPGIGSLSDIDLQNIFNSILTFSEVCHDVFAWANVFVNVPFLINFVFVVLAIDILQCCKRMIEFVIQFIPFL